MISIVVQCIGIIAHDKHSCAMHWDCIAYVKHSCAMLHRNELLMISIVMQCNRTI